MATLIINLEKTGFVELSELDFEIADEYWEKHVGIPQDHDLDNVEVAPKTLPHCLYFIQIEELEKILKEQKEKGATVAYIMDHTDHHGFELFFYKDTVVLPDQAEEVRRQAQIDYYQSEKNRLWAAKNRLQREEERLNKLLKELGV